MKTYAYIRVSTDAQDLNNQRHGVIEYAKKNGLEPLHFFEDTASGKKSWKERDLGSLIKQAKKGDVLLVAEISRLARSTLQVLEILQEAANVGIVVHVAKNQMVMDGSLNSRITAVVLGLAAEIEREFISARTTEALARRRAEGLPLGRPKGSKSETHKLDSEKARIEEMLARGANKTSVARIIGCSPDTLNIWMRANGLTRYIKARTPEEIKKRNPRNQKAISIVSDDRL